MQPDSAIRSAKQNARNRKNLDPTRDKLILVMRGYRVIEPSCDSECAAGSHCPFARGPNVDVAAPSCSTVAPSACPVGDSCLGREWQYSPPSARVFDVRFMDNLSVTSCGECFEAVHLPQMQNHVDYEQCTDVTLQGNASSPNRPNRVLHKFVHFESSGVAFVLPHHCHCRFTTGCVLRMWVYVCHSLAISLLTVPSTWSSIHQLRLTNHSLTGHTHNSHTLGIPHAVLLKARWIHTTT